MNRETFIHLNRKLNVTDLSGEKVMIDFESGKYYLLKGVGGDIWDIIQEDVTVGAVVDKLLAEYDVTPEECEESVVAFLEKLQEAGIIQSE